MSNNSYRSKPNTQYGSNLSLGSTSSSSGLTIDEKLYEAAVQPINKFVGHEPRLDIYKSSAEVEPSDIEYFKFEAGLMYNEKGRTYQIASDDGMSVTTSNTFSIAYSKWGWSNDGPFVLINHGVPSNQTQWYATARYLAKAGFRIVIFDQLCMGWSTKPLFNNEEKLEKLRWHNDVYYVDLLADFVFGANTKFIYLADDWGTGILHKYLEVHSDRVIWAGDQDGIRGGAYPVPEIEDIGQASMLPIDINPEALAGKVPPKPGSFQMAMGGANSQITQILKTMSFRQAEKYDQWSMRDILRPFFSVDYERDALDPRGAAAPFSMPHKIFALKSMADRAVAALRSGDLMPWHRTRNPYGIKYSKIKINFFLWSGENDNMMSRNQRLRYKYWMANSRVMTALIPRAGHFSGADQPEWIATNIVEFHNFLFPPGRPGSLRVAFLGFDGIFKGNEKEEQKAYELIYKMK